jgi:hypothetical protein
MTMPWNVVERKIGRAGGVKRLDHLGQVAH